MKESFDKERKPEIKKVLNVIKDNRIQIYRLPEFMLLENCERKRNCENDECTHIHIDCDKTIGKVIRKVRMTMVGLNFFVCVFFLWWLIETKTKGCLSLFFVNFDFF